MSTEQLEDALWKKHYNADGYCLNCGEWFYHAHQPTCPWSDERLNERVICGDCLRPSCRGCGR